MKTVQSDCLQIDFLLTSRTNCSDPQQRYPPVDLQDRAICLTHIGGPIFHQYRVLVWNLHGGALIYSAWNLLLISARMHLHQDTLFEGGRAKLYVTYSEGLAVCCGEQRIFVVSHPAECVSEECDGQNYGLEKLGSIGLFVFEI